MRKFPLATVLTITTGKLLCDVGEVYEILNYMTSDDLMTHQLPRAGRECAGPLLDQHPELANVVVPDSVNSWETVKAFLATLKFDAELSVEPLDGEDHTYIDPLMELAQMTDKPIIVITPEKE